jgi:replication factor C large subunit
VCSPFQPIILIANDLYGLDPAIRSLCTKIQFRAIQARSITPRLKEICIDEGVSCDISALSDISERSGGDIRSAVNMLYAATIGRTKLTEETSSSSQKDGRATIFDLVSATISSRSTRSLIELSYEVNETPDTEIQWIEGNIGLMKEPGPVCGAWRALSRADEFLGRTYIAQYYTLWRYASALMLLGVRSQAPSSGGYNKIMPPERWKRMSVAKRQKSARELLLTRLGRAMHMASGTVRKEYLAPVSLMAQHDPERYAQEFSLDADQLDLLIQDSEVAKNVIKKIEEKRKEAERELKKCQKEEAASLKAKKKEVKTTGASGSPETEKSEPEEETPPSSDHTDKETKAGEKTEKNPSQSTLFSFGG